MRTYIFRRDHFGLWGQSRVNRLDLHREELQQQSIFSLLVHFAAAMTRVRSKESSILWQVPYLDLVLERLNVIYDLIQDKSFADNLIDFPENQRSQGGEREWDENGRRQYLVTARDHVLQNPHPLADLLPPRLSSYSVMIQDWKNFVIIDWRTNRFLEKNPLGNCFRFRGSISRSLAPGAAGRDSVQPLLYLE